MPKLELEITLRLGDIVRSHFRAMLDLVAVRLWIVCLVLASGAWLLLVLGLIRTGEGADIDAARLFAASAALGLAILATGIAARRVVRQAHRHFASLSESERRGSYVLDESGFSWSLGKSPGGRRWDDVRRADESRNYVFLHERRGVTHALPKRDLDPECQTRLRRVLSEALADRAFL